MKAVWRREQILRLIEGALVFLRWGLLMFLCGVIIDWQTHMPAPGRVVILLAVLGVPLYKAWVAGWKHVRPFNATCTALQIEEQKGGMESLLVTALQLGNAAQRHGTSDALCDLTCRKAEESAGDIRPNETARAESLRRPVVIALAERLGYSRDSKGFAGMAATAACDWEAAETHFRKALRLAEELPLADRVTGEGSPDHELDAA